METLILIMTAAATMLSNVAIAYLLYRVAVKDKAEAEAMREPELTPEQKEKERLLREKRELLEEGFQNMMDYDGSPEKGGF